MAGKYRRSGRKMTKEEILSSYYADFKHKCKCGHNVVMSSSTEKKICSWCGNYVFQNEEIKKEYRKREVLNKIKEMIK